MDKRGVELALNTIILIILGVLILIFLVVMITLQGGDFSNFINNLLGKSNVDSVVTSCNSLQLQQSFFNYCCENKTLKYVQDATEYKEEKTCKEIREMQITGGRINSLDCTNAGC